ncbi:MAG: ribosome biogenesis GTP-binding protein YihA/YsxC [Gammaproteobacteria bacterium]|nr:ribosome biogenesis GTP-binding protein YihA/YsxC [Gammaproteobacteria bacterium]
MHPLYQQAHFLTSAPGIQQAPPDQGLEVAFAGRSNAGKSSALNRITHQKQLARISKQPGRTQQLNFFQLDDERRLVDLPGYGFAKVSVKTQARWGQAIERYLLERTSLQGLVIVMDVRHPLKEYDCQLLAWCAEQALPTHILLSKADKLSKGTAGQVLFKVRKSLDEMGLPANAQLFSSSNSQGVNECHRVLDQWLGATPIQDSELAR